MHRYFVYGLPALGFALIIITGFLALSPKQVTSFHRNAPKFEIQGLSSHILKSTDNEIALVNIFASWCLPCEAEHPFIEKIAKDIPVYGIAFIDKKEDTDNFLKRLGNPYKNIGYDTDGIAGVSWSIKGIPTSFIINSDYEIIYRHDGPITPEIATKIMSLKESKKSE